MASDLTPEANPKAFPWPQGEGYGEGGMTLRDWFAGQALAGQTASHAGVDYKRDAQRAYAFADAMLAERKRS